MYIYIYVCMYFYVRGSVFGTESFPPHIGMVPPLPTGWGGCFSFGGTVQYIEESNIYLCFVVCRLKRGLVT